jgi:hypothetical protein
MALTLTKKMKWRLALIPVALVLLIVGYEGLRVWWNRGYSKGSRTGVVRKVSVKGPPYCKYLEGEMAVEGSNALAPEIWKFSVDDDSDTNPIVVALKEAERAHKPVTIDYRQDQGALFRCSDVEYFVTKVEK